MLKKYIYLSCIFLLISFSLTRCGLIDALFSDPISIFKPSPKVNSISFWPQYFCSGDPITVTWNTENIDEIQLLDDDNNVIYSTTLAIGSWTTTSINKDMLPLKIRGTVDDQSVTREVDYLINIDNPKWTEYILSTSELIKPNSQKLRFIDSVWVPGPNGTSIKIAKYEVSFKYLGFEWNLNEVGFSNKAKIDHIQNHISERLRFKIISTGEQMQLDYLEIDQLQNPAPPGYINGEYIPPVDEFWGFQYAEDTKPPSPGFSREKKREDKVAKIRVRTFCDID